MYRIFLDSGAPTLYNKLARKKPDNGASFMGSHIKDRVHDDFSWLTDELYIEYRDEYIQYIKDNMDQLEVYTNLDIVNNAEATWENQQYLESKGVKPLPVWHFGSDVKWLKHYLRKGYDYIGIGGIVPNPYTVVRPALDRIFKEILCDSSGIPLVKIHGFAASSIKMMTRYPWYSIDSASWIKYAAFGGIMIPQKIHGKYRYTADPIKVNVSIKSPNRKIYGKHIDNLSTETKRRVIEYIEESGFTLGKSTMKNDKEHCIQKGLCNQPSERCLINALFYYRLSQELPEWPWPFKATKGLSLW